MGFLLDLHRDIDQLRIEIEVTSLYDIFLQQDNDVAAITQHNVKLHVIVIPIFNVVLYQIKMKMRVMMVNSSFYFTSEGRKVFLEILQNSEESTCARVYIS